jgi:hypothetical protein
MKVAGIVVALLPLICAAAEPLMPTAEGTTWRYELTQERPSEDLDLTQPNKSETIPVRYRIGGLEKIDNQDLHRLEIYRGDTLENTDLISVNDHEIICPARADNKGIVKISPPQQMVLGPLSAGTDWKFDGRIGDTKVSQNYHVSGEEDVDVPAGKFRAWRIHCDQTAPTRGSIDRWFVAGIGFVRVDTTITTEAGSLLQKTRLNLTERPKIAVAAPERPRSSDQFNVGVSADPKGDFKTEFKTDTPALYVRWRGQRMRPETEIRAVFIAENVADVTADYQIDDSTAVAPTSNASGTFTLSRPDDGWMPGDYRIEFYVDDALTATTKLKIVK